MPHATTPFSYRSVYDFDLRSVMYHGVMSIVYHAVDKRSGITVALKLYKRHKLSAIERHQVHCSLAWVP
jgi:aurora kinase